VSRSRRSRSAHGTLRRGCVPELRAWYAERMSFARSRSTKRCFCLGLAVSSVSLGCSARFSATENGTGDTSVGGSAGLESRAGAASGGQHEGGTNTGGANGGTGPGAAGDSGDSAGGRSTGGRNAGGRSATGGVGGGFAGKSGAGGAPAGPAGAPGGGSSGSSASAGRGGSRPCDLQECFVANTCLDKCGGKVVYTGCCACVPPSVNQITCTGTD
jgi:hypothetical protein